MRFAIRRDGEVTQVPQIYFDLTWPSSLFIHFGEEDHLQLPGAILVDERTAHALRQQKEALVDIGDGRVLRQTVRLVPEGEIYVLECTSPPPGHTEESAVHQGCLWGAFN